MLPILAATLQHLIWCTDHLELGRRPDAGGHRVRVPAAEREGRLLRGVKVIVDDALPVVQVFERLAHRIVLLCANAAPAPDARGSPRPLASVLSLQTTIAAPQAQVFLLDPGAAVLAPQQAIEGFVRQRHPLAAIGYGERFRRQKAREILGGPLEQELPRLAQGVAAGCARSLVAPDARRAIDVNVAEGGVRSAVPTPLANAPVLNC
mmetsp:Transcript_88688/g.271550  ORF Transcript_88688/g.271550 Transcript_88688/m.271550 type:complete len:207 (-) Transcript_88688:124-744(-)